MLTDDTVIGTIKWPTRIENVVEFQHVKFSDLSEPYRAYFKAAEARLNSWTEGYVKAIPGSGPASDWLDKGELATDCIRLALDERLDSKHRAEKAEAESVSLFDSLKVVNDRLHQAEARLAEAKRLMQGAHEMLCPQLEDWRANCTCGIPAFLAGGEEE